MKKFKWNVAFVVLTFCACVGVICYAAVKIDTAVTVDNIVTPETPVIVLDAGHGGMDGGCSTADGKTEKALRE